MGKFIILFIITVGLAATLYLTLRQTSFFSKAGPTDAPQKIRITNVSDTSFTVSWTTQIKVLGFITYKTKGGRENTVYDDRDATPQKHFTHHISIKYLNPATAYLFKVGSGSKVYDNSGTMFEQATAPIASNTPPLAQPVFGKIVQANKTAPDEALIYMQIPGKQPLSAYIQKDGNFLITLNNARTADLTNYIQVDEGQSFDYLVDSGPQGHTKGSAKVNTRKAMENIVLSDPSLNEQN